jgi:hypothetical protein
MSLSARKYNLVFTLDLNAEIDLNAELYLQLGARSQRGDAERRRQQGERISQLRFLGLLGEFLPLPLNFSLWLNSAKSPNLRASALNTRSRSSLARPPARGTYFCRGSKSRRANITWSLRSISTRSTRAD